MLVDVVLRPVVNYRFCGIKTCGTKHIFSFSVLKDAGVSILKIIINKWFHVNFEDFLCFSLPKVKCRNTPPA